MNLAERAWALLNQAQEVYADSPRATNWLRRHLQRFTEPLRVAVVGPPDSGKTTLVGALVGGQVDEQAAADGTRLLSWHHVAADRSRPELTVLDTSAVEPDTEARVVDSVCMEADAVLYLAGHPHSADLSVLRAVQDHPVGRVAPVNSLFVLSRADELGGGRVDALVSARQVARRCVKDAAISAVCQDVVAVAGLAACGGLTLRDDEFELLTGLAAAPKQQLDALLLSVDRFAADPQRARLVERLGLYGVRLATTLIRQGCDSPPALAAELRRRSGLGELWDAISVYFAERALVLKARSALIGLDVVLRMEPRPAAAPLAAEFERTLTGAHEFHESRLFATLRTGRVRLPAQLREEAIRLVGGYGHEPEARLGIDSVGPGSWPGLRQAAAGALRLWRSYAQSPMFGAAERQAAETVVRTCEALLTEPVP